MPRFSEPIVDASGRQIGIACGHRRRRACATPGCRNDATIQCDFGVTRLGRAGTCDRWCCRSCAVSVGKNRDHCPVHARTGGALAKPGGQLELTPRSLEGVTSELSSSTLLTPRPELKVRR